MDCAGAAQVFPHCRFNRAISCDSSRGLRCYMETRLYAQIAEISDQVNVVR